MRHSWFETLQAIDDRLDMGHPGTVVEAALDGVGRQDGGDIRIGLDELAEVDALVEGPQGVALHDGVGRGAVETGVDEAREQA